MGISPQIEAVYQRALLLRERATASPADPALLEEALRELYFVLEELHAVDSDLQLQNQRLVDAQQQIEIERQRYQALFELAPDGYLVTDAQGIIYQANQAAAALLAVPQANLLRKPLVVFIETCDRPNFQNRLNQPESAQTWEMAIRHRFGSPVKVAIATATVQKDQGQDKAILWSLRPVSLPRPESDPEIPPTV